MYYITVKQPPSYHQMTLEEFLFGGNVQPELINENLTNTRTYEVENVSERFLQLVDIDKLIARLVWFNERTEYLRESQDVNGIMSSTFQKRVAVLEK